MKWSIYNSETGRYTESIISEIQPDNSTDKEILIPIEFARFDGNNWIDIRTPEEILQLNTIIVPVEVPLWKIRFILNQMGLENSVSIAINQLMEPQRTAANYIWQYGYLIERSSETVEFIKNILNLTDNQVDEIFISSEKILL